MCPTMTSVSHFAAQQRNGINYGKQRLERCVLRRLPKTAGDGAGVTWCGKPFQTRAATTGKARSPTVDSRVRRTISNGDEADGRRRRALVGGLYGGDCN